MYTQYLPTFPLEMLVNIFHNALHLLCIVFIMSCPPGNELETHLGRGRMFVPTKVITIHMFILFCSSSSLALTAWYMFSGGSFNPSVGTTGHPVRPTENGRRSSLRSHNTSVLVDGGFYRGIFQKKYVYPTPTGSMGLVYLSTSSRWLNQPIWKICSSNWIMKTNM